MLYEDPVTGALHEIPDGQVSGWGFAEDPYGMGEVVFDGLGNPLGFSFRKAFGTLVKKAAPFATSMLGPYGQIINRALPIVRQALRPTAQALRQQALQQMRSGFAEVPATAAPMAMQRTAVPVAATRMAPHARRLPPGWIRPAVPYAGPHGRRLYLRCAAWPGPRGLVPANPGQPTAAPVQAPGVVMAPAAPTVMPRRVSRRRR